jgi:hypothetical protein
VAQVEAPITAAPPMGTPATARQLEGSDDRYAPTALAADSDVGGEAPLNADGHCQAQRVLGRS